MSQDVTVQLSDEAYAALQRQAEATGASVAEVATNLLENQARPLTASRAADKPKARGALERHFGAIDLGRPTGADDESITADLAREYADTHEE